MNLGSLPIKLLKKIIDCDVLVADLSETNPNVFYELAIRHGLKKPFVHLIDVAEKIPFDNSQVRTITFDIQDLDSVDVAKRQLKSQVENIESGEGSAESPISVAFDLEALKTSGKEDAGILSVLLDEVMVLGREVRGMRAGTLTRKRFIEFSSKSELLQFLYEEGHKPLMDLVENYVTYANSTEANLTIATSLDTEREQVLVSDLQNFLSKKTGRNWSVTDLPF